MVRRFFHSFVLIAGFTVAGCSDDDTAQHERANTYSHDEAEFAVEEADDAEDSEGETETSDEETNSNTEDITDVDASDQMIIYNGNISIEVGQFDEAQRQIEAHVEQMDGYIVESTVHDRDDEEDRSGTFSARIPQQNFTPFLDELEVIGTEVLERSTYGDDVTEEYVDLESRLQSQETVEERLLTFMEEAENTEDLLAISDDLASTQEEIEQIEGRMNYLENHVAYSTVSINVQEVAASTLQDRQSLNTWRQATSLFTDTVNVLVSFFSGLAVFLIGFSPVLVPLLLIGATVVFFLKRR
ncbi:DUF4349 domain-containing protein [Salicibibacter kimchii]|uniref:DUF4349 domain-containing protein n=1 Tax=Salicibibacter kimchii TaxID=2099786 RepID=A0A345BYZ2_9BACI|nr:DUF4349 domain-containing protein [Salicibibacter kimchii]AXF56173.1 DUF4349 domain-containing protein [Salicibibacter kimchii]